MHPELFKIPFINLTLPSYGLMLVIGFLAAVFIIKRLSTQLSPDPQLITNAALYSLIAGVVGARLFYVLHYFENFHDEPLSVFAIWKGGLELLGGVLLAILVIIFYLRRHKLPIRRYLDILAIGLMLALAFGRIGCFLNGCCFGKPTNLPWGVRFPYRSFAYISQVNPDPERNRHFPYLILPADFFGYRGQDGLWYSNLKPYELLTVEQKQMVDKDPYRCLPVHPTQLYESASAALYCLVLYIFRRRAQLASAKRSEDVRMEKLKIAEKFLAKQGQIFALMFVLYSITRFFLEFLRDDNPFEFDSLTISQNICIALFILGISLLVIFQKMKADAFVAPRLQKP
jgi:phosphatidylglycerol:prolipoprotein diacylglycerol transferase